MVSDYSCDYNSGRTCLLICMSLASGRSMLSVGVFCRVCTLPGLIHKGMGGGHNSHLFVLIFLSIFV